MVKYTDLFIEIYERKLVKASFSRIFQWHAYILTALPNRHDTPIGQPVKKNKHMFRFIMIW